MEGYTAGYIAMADNKNRGSGDLLFGGESGTLPLRLDFSSLQRNRNGGVGAVRSVKLPSKS